MDNIIQRIQCDNDEDCDFSIVEAMLSKERTTYAQHDYFAMSTATTIATASISGNSINNNNNNNNSHSAPAAVAVAVDPSCRFVMAKWCISLCKFCNYDRGMVASIMSCVDRFVSTPKGSQILFDRDKYQLAVMSSLYLVAKIQQAQALEPSSMAKLSRGKYSKHDIESMELDILEALEWCVNPPTPTEFAHEFLRNFNFIPEDDDHDDDDSMNDDSMNDDSMNDGESSSTSTSTTSTSTSTTEQRIIELVNCQIEEATCNYELSCLNRPSHVAFGALSNALESLGIVQNKQMTKLKERLQISTTDDDDDDDDDVSAALFRVVSSLESPNSLSALLTRTRCSNSNNNNRAEQNKTNGTRRPSLTKTASSSSCVHSSPRTVVEGILC